MFSKKEIDLNLRSEPDFWVKSITRFASVAWYLAFSSLLVAGISIPFVRTSLYINFGLKLKGQTLNIFNQVAFGLLVATFVVSVVGLIINSKRHRRRTDRYNFSLVFLAIASVLCIIGCLIFVLI